MIQAPPIVPAGPRRTRANTPTTPDIRPPPTDFADPLEVRLIDKFIGGVELLEIASAVVERACALTGELKSLDAIHLATATLLDRPRDPVTVLTHDARLAAAARARSLAVVDPLAA